ncbi:hypothetical protein [Brucella tritici]
MESSAFSGCCHGGLPRMIELVDACRYPLDELASASVSRTPRA